MPHALLPANVFSVTRSLRPPASVMPVPSRPGAPPEVGVPPLLFSMIRLWVITQQMFLRCAPGGGEGFSLPSGHRPSCGAGASSLFWLVVGEPSSLVLDLGFGIVRG